MEDKKLTVSEPAREVPVRLDVDVLVVGGGPSGIIAAQAAAEDGLKVALIDSRSFLGGNLTIGLPILGFLGQKGNQIIKGLPDKFIKYSFGSVIKKKKVQMQKKQYAFHRFFNL